MSETTTPETEVKKKEPRITMRSLLMVALRAGITDNPTLIKLVQDQIPDTEEKRILTSLAVHRSVLRKEAAAKTAAAIAG